MGIVKDTLVKISAGYSDLADYMEDVLGADEDDLTNLAWAEERIKELNEKRIRRLGGVEQDTAEKKKVNFEKVIMSNNVLPAITKQADNAFLEEVKSEVSSANSISDFAGITLRSGNKPERERFESFSEAERTLDGGVETFTQEKASGLRARTSLQDLKADISSKNFRNEKELLDIIDKRIAVTARAEGRLVTSYRARFRTAKTIEEVDGSLLEARRDADVTPKSLKSIEEMAELRKELIKEEE